MLGTPVMVARRVTVTARADQLLTRPLPMVCAISGVPATETLKARISGRHTPLWLLLLGIAPYVVVRLLLGSGDSGLSIQLPYARAVADRLALLQAAQIISWCLVGVFLVVAGVTGVGAVTIGAGVGVLLALMTTHLAGALLVKPVLRDGLLQLEVSHQLAAAVSQVNVTVS